MRFCTSLAQKDSKNRTYILHPCVFYDTCNLHLNRYINILTRKMDLKYHKHGRMRKMCVYFTGSNQNGIYRKKLKKKKKESKVAYCFLKNTPFPLR